MTGPGRSYLVRPSHTYVHVPARVAHVLYLRLGIAKLRVQVRGVDPETSAVLEALSQAALEWSSAVGTGIDESPEPVRSLKQSKTVTSIEAAAELSMTDRAIRKALNEGRLQGTKTGGRWEIQRTDLAHFNAARAT